VSGVAGKLRVSIPLGLYRKCSLEFGVIVMNLKAMVPRMLDGVRRYLEVLCLASYQGHAFPTLIVLL
jgi:hypothetical protein